MKEAYYLTEDQYTKRDRTDFIVVHCAATGPSQDIGVKEIRKWHVEERGWLDVGYHFVIRRNGTIELGRPLWAIGSHVLNYNRTSVGICLVGGTPDGQPNVEENNFTDEQRAALETLTVMLSGLYPLAVVQGHRDFKGVQKFCPSFDVKPWFHDLTKRRIYR